MHTTKTPMHMKAEGIMMETTELKDLTVVFILRKKTA